ncbi:MAG: ATP synthase F1 subunit delta [Crocinitomicaceae bacterium]|jgi:F-type H+-transporting ATPase subunit delta|nr:ATP synthase F1 subunit delta [Crocinitomicaceae bacterium]
MKGSKVPARYAQALLEITEEQQKTDAAVSNMRDLSVTASDNREFELFLKNPIIKSDKKIAVLEKIFNHFDEVSMAFIRLITKNGREALLPAIAHEFDARVKNARGIVPITLTSAVALDKSVKDTVVKKLSAQVEGKLEIEEKLDDKLIGGFMVRMGDVQIDASILRQFKEMRKNLMR